MTGGMGRNTKAELLALWALLKFSLSKGVTSLKFFGDYKVIIDWVFGTFVLPSLLLNQWGDRVHECVQSFDQISFHHIYKELNETADRLSKKALKCSPRIVSIVEFKDNALVSLNTFQYI